MESGGRDGMEGTEGGVEEKEGGGVEDGRELLCLPRRRKAAQRAATTRTGVPNLKGF